MQTEGIINLIKTEPYKIGHLLGFDKLTELHNEWIKKFLFIENDYTLQAHRGSYKTSALSIAFAIHLIIRPDSPVLFMRKTDADITEIIRQVSGFLKTDVIRSIAYTFYKNDLKLTKDTNNEINTNLNISARGVSQLTGMGVNGSLTGKHYDTIFTDDIVNIKDRISHAEREHTKLIYQELQNVKNRGGKIINTGTCWHKEDCFSIMPKPEVYTCYDTGLMSKDDIQAVRGVMTPSLFAANYELKHIADENALFTNPQFIKDDELLYNGQAHVDAAYGGEDYTALTIIKKASDGNLYAFGKLYKKHVDNCITDMQIQAKRFLAGTWLNEKNADKGYLSEKLSNMGIPNYSYSEHMNKHIKICTHLYQNWSKIYWHEDTDSEYLNQILDYTEEAEHDDAPDSAASLCRHLVSKQITAVDGLRL